MAFYDYKINKVVRFPTERQGDWLMVDCGCSNGLQWGGEEPRECRDCCGMGYQWVHLASGAIRVAGKLHGKLSKKELKTYQNVYKSKREGK